MRLLQMKVIFYIKYHTRFGERLAMITPAAAMQPAVAYLEMQYLNDEYWKLEADINPAEWPDGRFSYKYVFIAGDGTQTEEFQQFRTLLVNDQATAVLKVYDTWNYAGDVVNTFATAPFQNVLLPQRKPAAIKIGKEVTHIFAVKAPLLSPDEAVCLLGDAVELGNWNTSAPLMLKYDGGQWIASLPLRNVQFPVAYKYGIYDKVQGLFKQFETGGNRICFEPAAAGERALLQDGFLRTPADQWRGSGIAIPVFSLRSKDGLGVGEFSDLKLLTDWAVKTGLKMIQILPVNDTTATNTWLDSYPYAAISAFALHPVYINLEGVEGKKSREIKESVKAARKRLNELAHVDYEAVMHFKTGILRTLYKEYGTACLESNGYREFWDHNRQWLKPYAAFCYLRDLYQSPDPARWHTNSVYADDEISRFFEPGDERQQLVNFYCYVQYQLHLQLTDAVAYAHKKGVVIKGDIPIGVYRYGADAWVAPALYKMEVQAGAPPDDFAIKGQNWGFPTYNWARMQEDGFAWWRERFRQMSYYFDAFRIDHILGFFRIWSIPVDAVQGIMGTFDPCIPVSVSEFGELGIWFDYDRFCLPYITDEVLWELFNDRSDFVKTEFLQRHGPNQYVLRPAFDTQRKVEAYFKDQPDGAHAGLRDGLYDLISNVILFEQPGSEKTAFHFRIALDHTSSFRSLPSSTKDKIWPLYIDYFYRRQNDFWRKESLKKLPGLKAVTNMLVCGEDLGMVPDTVPGVMKELGILSLEIQRMPKQQDVTFFNPADAPYLSVVTPSTHDMSTIRGWWQENRALTQRFYNSELGQSGDAPYFCEPWINRAIVLQHLYSPAMWSIFQLQDILGMSATLRRENPEDERINIPANPHHYWRYRMHISLEQLLKENDFNEELKGYIQHSGR